MTTVTITYLGIELLVEGDTSPAEPRSWRDPGCLADFDPYSIKIGGVECFEVFACLSERSQRNKLISHSDCLHEIKNLCLEQLSYDI